MEINTKQIRTKLEISKLQQTFDKVQVNDDAVVVFDFEEDEDYPAVFTWMLDEDRAYSEDMTLPRGDDADDIISANQFSDWIQSFYD